MPESQTNTLPDTATTDGGTTFNHPFGGAIEVYPLSGGGKRFWVALRGLDEDACEDMLGTYIGMTRSRSGLVGASVDVGTGTPTALPSAGTAQTASSTAFPVKARLGGPTGAYTLAQVDTACNGGDGLHNIWFLFG